MLPFHVQGPGSSFNSANKNNSVCALLVSGPVRHQHLPCCSNRVRAGKALQVTMIHAQHKVKLLSRARFFSLWFQRHSLQVFSKEKSLLMVIPLPQPIVQNHIVHMSQLCLDFLVQCLYFLEFLIDSKLSFLNRSISKCIPGKNYYATFYPLPPHHPEFKNLTLQGMVVYAYNPKSRGRMTAASRRPAWAIQ